MSWKYELTGDATLVEFPVPGTGELVRLGKGGDKTVELDQLITHLPAGVKCTEVKAAKKAAADDEEEAS